MLCLVLSFILPSTAYVANADNVMPLASYYLDAYNSYICDVGSGKIEIWFEVMGTGDMDEIGVLSIILYESSNNRDWTRVETFLHEDYDTMLAEDDWYHCSYVPYQGTTGKYYKAYVCIWAGKDGDGDSRYMWAIMV